MNRERALRTAAPRCDCSHLRNPDRSDSNPAVKPSGAGLRLTGTHAAQAACCARTLPRQCVHTNHTQPATSTSTTTRWKRWNISLNRGSLSQ
jgi:hypothetical protein